MKMKPFQTFLSKSAQIFVGLNIAKSDIFGSKLTETMAMIFFGKKTLSS